MELERIGPSRAIVNTRSYSIRGRSSGPGASGPVTGVGGIDDEDPELDDTDDNESEEDEELNEYYDNRGRREVLVITRADGSRVLTIYA